MTDVQAWFGLVNKVSYAFSMADRMLSFRELQNPDNRFEWTDNFQKLFDESKQVIACEVERHVTIFDSTKPTGGLANDWSKMGIGYYGRTFRMNPSNHFVVQ